MFHNFFILFSSVSPSTACCPFSLDTTCPNNHISFIHHMLLFICNAPTLRCKSQDFNTSHVTLYRHKTLEGAAFVGFQYVSCYSLSIEQKAYEDGFTVFQYISCYSLSGRGCCCTSSRFVSIHLMLLFITMTKGVFSEFEGFNTSHVTLYRKCGSGVVYQPMVSIHLMLLFIRHDLDEKGIAYPFQYISCYSLSGHQAINACLTSAFQYISCYSLSRGFSALPWP